MNNDTASLNAFWAELIVEELVRNGVDTFVISPGSRSTPLTVAAARNAKAKTIVHYDERGAAFFALGVAKALGNQCALICTSGTAVANYFPAIVEASMSHVPLIVLTADRPPELQDTGANQTIDQTRIYGEYVRHFVAMPCPDANIPPEFVLTTIDQACNAAQRSPTGPVHINCAYREPLIQTDAARESQDDKLYVWRESNRPYTTYAEYAPAIDAEQMASLAARITAKPNVLFIFGQDESNTANDGANSSGTFLDRQPVFADTTSRVTTGRKRTAAGQAIECFDLMLLSPEFKELCQPDVVIHFGGPLISKRLQEHFASVRPAVYVRVSEHGGRKDPNHQVTHRCHCSPDEFLRAWNAAAPEDAFNWTLRLEIASERAQKAVWDVLKHENGLTEIDAMIALGDAVRKVPSARIFAGNSMPIRYMDMYGGLVDAGVPVIANRGASGIDGNIATAAGYAKASGKHVVAMIGDLAALHDLNSLALLKQEGVRVTLVILNNDGGGIFHYLPIAEHSDMFEKYFATPHGMTFDHAARMFGLPYNKPAARDEFETALRAALGPGESSIIEVATNRDENLRLHRRICDAVVKALEDR